MRRLTLLILALVAWLQRHAPPGYAKSSSVIGRLAMSRDLQTLVASPVFDAERYVEWNPDVDFFNITPKDHYLRFGIWENRDPGPLFSCAYYGDRNPDVSNLPAVPHYVLFGDAEGRKPNELFDPNWVKPFLVDLGEDFGTSLVAFAHNWHVVDVWPNPLFDSKWYAAEYQEDLPLGIVPLAHFLSGRNADMFNPNPLFDSKWYRERYPWIGGMRPLSHYLEHGSLMAYDPSPTVSGGLLRAEAPAILGSQA